MKHPSQLIDAVVAESHRVNAQFFEENKDRIARTAEIIAGALRNGRKILLFGNGGSAADAQHMAAEMVGRFGPDRSPLPAISLTTAGSSARRRPISPSILAAQPISRRCGRCGCRSEANMRVLPKVCGRSFPFAKACDRARWSSGSLPARCITLQRQRGYAPCWLRRGWLVSLRCSTASGWRCADPVLYQPVLF